MPSVTTIALVSIAALLGFASMRRTTRSPRAQVQAEDLAVLRGELETVERREAIVREIDRVFVRGAYFVPEGAGSALLAAATDVSVVVREAALETLGRIYVRLDSPGGPMNVELMDEVGRLVARRGASDCDSPREAHLLGELHGKFGRPRDVNSSPPASAVGVAYIDGIVEGVLHHDEVPWAWLDALEGMLAPEAFAELRDVWLG